MTVLAIAGAVLALAHLIILHLLTFITKLTGKQLKQLSRYESFSRGAICQRLLRARATLLLLLLCLLLGETASQQVQELLHRAALLNQEAVFDPSYHYRQHPSGEQHRVLWHDIEDEDEEGLIATPGSGPKPKMVRTVMHNPLAASRVDRLQEYSVLLPQEEFVVLVGTQKRKAEHGMPTKIELENHIAIEFGWGRGKHTNKSTGITILLHKKNWPLSTIAAVHEAPGQLQGRGAAIRVRKGQEDLLIGGLYFPVRAGKRHLFQEGSLKLLEWADGIMNKTPVRTMPIWHIDLNDGLGLQRERGAGLIHIESEAVGDQGAAEEHENGTALRQWLERHHMQAIGTKNDTGDTWFGATSSKKIDYVLVPQSAEVRSHNTMSQKGRELQLIRTATVRDHLPLHSNIASRYSYEQHEKGLPTIR